MLALLALALAAAPLHFDTTLALTIRGERVGAVHLRFDGAQFRYESLTVVRRGGTSSTVRFGATTDALGRGRTDDDRALNGPLPSTLALWLFENGAPARCIAAQDERDGHRGEVCASRSGQTLAGTLLGEKFSAGFDSGGTLAWLELPAQLARFDRVEGALPLPTPRDLFGHAFQARELAALQDADSARVVGQGDGCSVNLELTKAGPRRDEPLAAPLANGWQSDARDLRLGTRTRWATAIALARFVDQAIASVGASPADEDARGAWRARRASCVGQARVFHALADAVGLPSRVVFGALVEDGQVGAHAWDEVEIDGRWYGVDPSRAQAPVGPDHVPFAREGDPDPLRAGRCLLALPSMRWTVQAP